MTSHGLTPRQFLARRRRARAALAVILLLTAAAIAYADQRGLLLPRHDDLLNYHNQTFPVARVIDGDTLDIAAPDEGRPVTRVRLIGVDTPEIAHPHFNDKPAQPLGPEAADFTRGLCLGHRVKIRVEPAQLRDRSDRRLMAYVDLPDGTVLNERLLSVGLARTVTDFPHAALERYALLEKQARADRAGIWGLAPAIRRRIKQPASRPQNAAPPPASSIEPSPEAGEGD